jgi:hypothetical protein
MIPEYFSTFSLAKSESRLHAFVSRKHQRIMHLATLSLFIGSLSPLSFSSLALSLVFYRLFSSDVRESSIKK